METVEEELASAWAAWETQRKQYVERKSGGGDVGMMEMDTDGVAEELGAQEAPGEEGQEGDNAPKKGRPPPDRSPGLVEDMECEVPGWRNEVSDVGSSRIDGKRPRECEGEQRGGGEAEQPRKRSRGGKQRKKKKGRGNW